MPHPAQGGLALFRFPFSKAEGVDGGISRVNGWVGWNFVGGEATMGIDLGGGMGYIKWLGMGREKDI